MAPRRPPSHRLAALLAALAVVCLAVDVLFPPLFGRARLVTLTVSDPVRGRAERISDRASLAWQGLVRYPDVAAENERLRAQLAVAESAPGRGSDAEAELRRLLAGSDLEFAADIPKVTAAVITDRVSPSGHLLEINKGSGSGIVEGMPVVTGRGLVGVATLVSEHRSIVTPITEPGSVIGVRSSDGIGVVSGQGRGEPLAITVEPDLADRVGDGDRLVTSGVTRSWFPGNIPVGWIRSGGEPRAEPFVDFDDLGYVSVMLWRPEP